MVQMNECADAGALDFNGEVGLPHERRRVFQNAATQKERSENHPAVGPVQQQFHWSRLSERYRFIERLLDLPREKEGDRAIVMFVVCIMVDELMQRRTDSEQRSPLEHRSQEQRDHWCSHRRPVSWPEGAVRLTPEFRPRETHPTLMRSERPGMPAFTGSRALKFPVSFHKNVLKNNRIKCNPDLRF